MTHPHMFKPSYATGLMLYLAARVAPTLCLCMPLTWSGLGATAELTADESSLFSGSGNCAFCHDQLGNALLDASGGSVAITEDWRGTMMAHAFKDPLWRAVMETEVAERPKLKGFIEDKCQRCHAPMAHTQHARDSEGELPYADALGSELAGDGVSCTLCHQIRPDGLGTDETFTGRYRIDDARQIFGPYGDVFTMPMLRHVNYTPVFGEHVGKSSICGTCHTLFTPVLDERNEVVGQFPEQTPFLERRASAFEREGKQCQDCHMQKLQESVKISARPPWLEPRAPFWRHQFVGGNTLLPRVMAAQSREVNPNGTPENLAETQARARAQLRRAARLSAQAARQGAEVRIKVRVENLTGHKFPTGHPYRRAWLLVRVMDGKRVLFESGAPDKNGALAPLAQSFAPHCDEIRRPEQVQVYESVMGDAAGNRTYSLLSATSYLKDNRIPPRGFAAVEPAIAVHGVETADSNFNTGGSGADEVVYVVNAAEAKGPLTALVSLLYQPVPPEAVERLRTREGHDAKQFTRFFRRVDKSPEIVQTANIRIE